MERDSDLRRLLLQPMYSSAPPGPLLGISGTSGRSSPACGVFRRLTYQIRLGRPNVLSLSRHVPSLPGGAMRSVAPNEARKRRASEWHVVGCCEELGRTASE